MAGRGGLQPLDSHSSASSEFSRFGLCLGHADPDLTTVAGNHVLGTAPGCYISYLDQDDPSSAWTLSKTRYSPDDFGLEPDESPPDLSVDPESHVLTAINASETEFRCFYITLEHPVAGRGGAPLKPGVCRDQKGVERPCVTLVLILSPRTVLDACTVLIPGRQLKAIRLHSDVSDVSIVSDFFESVDRCASAATYGFPLRAAGPVLCSQGHRGHFTHFNPCTRHAVDLQCPVGTPVLAIAGGRVVEVRDDNVVSGIHVRNLYRWNSLMLQLDDGMFVEYVHVQQHSALVRPGDRVAEGQQLCASGDVGFCPSPHLHIQMHTNGEKNAVTIPFAFRDGAGRPYIPEAGKYYTEDGLFEQEVSTTINSSSSP